MQGFYFSFHFILFFIFVFWFTEQRKRKNFKIFLFFIYLFSMRNDLFLEMYTIFYISPGNHNLRDEVWDHVCLSQNKVQNILAILLGIQVGQIVTKKKFRKTEQVGKREQGKSLQIWRYNGTREICNCSVENVMTMKVFLWLIYTVSGGVIFQF